MKFEPVRAHAVFQPVPHEPYTFPRPHQHQILFSTTLSSSSIACRIRYPIFSRNNRIPKGEHINHGRHAHELPRIPSLPRSTSRARAPPPILHLHPFPGLHSPIYLPLSHLCSTPRYLLCVLHSLPHRPRTTRALPETPLSMRLSHYIDPT